MKQHSRRPPTHRAAIVTAIAAITSAPGVAARAEASGAAWTVTPYAWATDIGIEARLGSRELETTIGVSDVMEDLDVTFQGRIERQKGAHGMMLDVFYAGLSDRANGVALPGGAGSADLDWEMDMTIADVALTWDPRGDRRGVSFLYGMRVIASDANTVATMSSSPAGGTERFESEDTLVDALVGVRFGHHVTRHLIYSMQADLSTGSTDLTWSTAPTLSWTFAGGRRALDVGYRRMSIDFEDNGQLDTEIVLSGPQVGFTFSF